MPTVNIRKLINFLMSGTIICTDHHPIGSEIKAFQAVRAAIMDKVVKNPDYADLEQSANEELYKKIFKAFGVTCHHCKTILVTEVTDII